MIQNDISYYQNMSDYAKAASILGFGFGLVAVVESIANSILGEDTMNSVIGIGIGFAVSLVSYAFSYRMYWFAIFARNEFAKQQAVSLLSQNKKQFLLMV